MQAFLLGFMCAVFLIAHKVHRFLSQLQTLRMQARNERLLPFPLEPISSTATGSNLSSLSSLLSSKKPRLLTIRSKTVNAQEVVWVIRYTRGDEEAAAAAAAAAAWFNDAENGRMVYGFYDERTHLDVKCKLPSAHGLVVEDTRRALLQAARCYPHGKYFVQVDDVRGVTAKARERMKEWMMKLKKGGDESVPHFCRADSEPQKPLRLLSRAAVRALERCAGVTLEQCLLEETTGVNTSSACAEAPIPELCIVLTFPAVVRVEDPLKRLAHDNAARTYAALGPRVQALVTRPIRAEEQAQWRMVVEAPLTNEHGTPLLSSLLTRARDACPDTPLVGYANADILFDRGLLSTLDALLAWDQREFLAVGRRRNHALQHEAEQLGVENVSQVESELFLEVAQDYFIMTRNLVDKLSAGLPPYVIGRRAYDNALNDWAFHHSFLVDLTETVTALHQTTADGNYAGHSDRNPDMEYNVQLPGAVYDHGSTLHAQYATVKHSDGTVVVKRKADKVWMTPQHRLKFTRRGARVFHDALPSPLFVVFGNAAYREMLANFLCNTALFPPMHAHTLVLVTDAATVEYLDALGTDAIVGLYAHESQSGHDYDTPEYVRLMLLRGQLLLTLLGKRVVVWMEADAEYKGNLLEHPAIARGNTDVVLYWDGTAYGGGFIRFAATEAARGLYENVVNRLARGVERGDYTNDQVILNDELTRQPHVTRAEFDRCEFRSGQYYHAEFSAEYKARCAQSGDGARWPMVQQHNWVIGNQRKMDMAKANGAWYYLEEGRCQPRDLRVTVMTLDRPRSLERLLVSLQSARYPEGAKVDVRVTVDRRRVDQAHDTETLDVLRRHAETWARGVFEVQLWEQPMGIFGQWVDSWPCEQFPAELYRAAVLLEDDLEVSPAYFEWFVKAHEVYASKDLGAVTGMRAQLVAQAGAPITQVDALVPRGLQVFAYRLIATWSMSPTYDAWRRFRAWVKEARAKDPPFDPGVDGTVPGQWYRDFKASGQEAGMWEIWFLRFMHDQNLYTLYPWLKDGSETVVCNWKEAGLHYDGRNPSRDYPLVESLPASVFAQSSVPYVDWGLGFYHCLVKHLFGSTSNQILTIAWAHKVAMEQRKFLRIAQIQGRKLHLLNHWDDMFDEAAFPFLVRDGVYNAQQCASEASFESSYHGMLEARAEGLVLPLPAAKLRARVAEAPVIRRSVHGRSLEGACAQFPLICRKGADESQVPDLCDYSAERVRALFFAKHIESAATEVVLFTDGQNQAMDRTYARVDERPLFEQIWAMVQSEQHVGNPRSSMDFMVSLWRKQLGLLRGMEPTACYAEAEDEETGAGAWNVWLSNPEIDCISADEVISCPMLAGKEALSEQTLMRSEALAMQTQRWIAAEQSHVLQGPVLVQSNGDVIVCNSGERYASGGCSNQNAAKKTHADACSSGQQQQQHHHHYWTEVEYLVVITQFWGEGYFHMMVEGLTRLAEAMRMMDGHEKTFSDPALIHVHSPSKQANDLVALMLMGGRGKVIAGDVLATRWALVPPNTPCGGHRWSLHARWLRALLLPSLRLVEPTRRLPLVVKRSGSRAILNHEELVASLGKGARVHTGNEPVSEQLELFANSGLVIGPHGAGLSNIVVMAEGSAVVELQTAPANHCYMFWAMNLGLRYFGYYEDGAVHDGNGWNVNVQRLLSSPAFH